MKTVSLTIDGKKIVAPEGQNVLWAALDNGIYIPNLCALHDRPEPAAACRLCFVEIDGYNRPVTACTETVREGMVVNTKGAKALRLAGTAFELLMASHPVDCGNCPANRSCELQKIAAHLRVKLKTKRFKKLVRDFPIDSSHPQFIYNPSKCVLCGRCVWVCQHHQGMEVLGFARRGFDRKVTIFYDQPMAESQCRDCKECVTVCPCGSLVLKNSNILRKQSTVREVV